MAPRALLVPALVLALLGTVLAFPKPASAAGYDARFAGYETPNGLFPDEVSAAWVVPSVSPDGAGLSTWVGLGGSDAVIQAGATVGPVYGTNCWWEDYPYSDQQAIPDLSCAPGDLILVDVAQGYYGPTQSRVIVVDATTGQSSGWLSVYTPDLSASPVAETMVEWNSSLGPAPASFTTVSFFWTTATVAGYVGSGGQLLSFSLLTDNGLVGETNNLTSMVPGVSVSEDGCADVETVNG
jgi:hypothetical protein